MADRPDHDLANRLATELERSQNAYIAKMSDGHNSIVVRSKDDELAECYRLMAAAAEGLRVLAYLTAAIDPDEPHPDADFIEVDYWCHFDDKGRAVRVHDTSTVHMDGCARMYVRAADR